MISSHPGSSLLVTKGKSAFSREAKRYLAKTFSYQPIGSSLVLDTFPKATFVASATGPSVLLFDDASVLLTWHAPDDRARILPVVFRLNPNLISRQGGEEDRELAALAKVKTDKDLQARVRADARRYIAQHRYLKDGWGERDVRPTFRTFKPAQTANRRRLISHLYVFYKTFESDLDAFTLRDGLLIDSFGAWALKPNLIVPQKSPLAPWANEMLTSPEWTQEDLCSQAWGMDISGEITTGLNANTTNFAHEWRFEKNAPDLGSAHAKARLAHDLARVPWFDKIDWTHL